MLCCILAQPARCPWHIINGATDPSCWTTLPLVRNQVVVLEGILPSKSEQDRVRCRCHVMEMRANFHNAVLSSENELFL